MINEKIIEGLRDYLKDHYIPSLVSSVTLGTTAAAECSCCKSISFKDLDEVEESDASEYYSDSCPPLFSKSKHVVRHTASLRKISDDASDYIKKHRKPWGFAHALDRKREEKGLTPAELYKKANIDRRQYSRFMGPEGRHPSMNTVISFALALRLDRREFDSFLQTAGYALSNSSSRDVCIMYCLENCIYDIDEVNTLLFAVGIEPLSRE